jgi:hypothetical protein
MLTKEQITYVKGRLKDILWDKERAIPSPIIVTDYYRINKNKGLPEEVKSALTTLNQYAEEEQLKFQQEKDKLTREFSRILDVLSLADRKDIDPFQLLEDFQKYNPK